MKKRQRKKYIKAMEELGSILLDLHRATLESNRLMDSIAHSLSKEDESIELTPQILCGMPEPTSPDLAGIMKAPYQSN